MFKTFYPSLIALALFAGAFAVADGPALVSSPKHEVYVLGELWITDWSRFEAQLKSLKEKGYQGISVDVWWGKVQEKSSDQFDWEYYDKVFKMVKEAGLKIIPILSTHECGGNVGDTVNIPVPRWFWEKYKDKDIKYVSEAGNVSEEFPSVWSTEEILEEFQRFWRAFQDRYAQYASIIEEIPISLGPSGELQYPFHHYHDRNLHEASYPQRGIIQAFSVRAQKSFQQWVFQVRYPGKDLEFLRKHWGLESLDASQVSPDLLFAEPGQNGLRPRSRSQVQSAVSVANQFFQNKLHQSELGKDLFRWNQWSLVRHMGMLLEGAVQTFQSEHSVFRQIPLGIKVPGVHWATDGERLPELSSGMVGTWDQSLEQFSARKILETKQIGDYGYRPLFEELKQVKQKHPSARLSVTYTAGEMPDTLPTDQHPSWGQTQVRSLTQLAKEYGVLITAENAIGGYLYDKDSVNRLFELPLSRLTLLRINEALDSKLIVEQMSNERAKTRSCSDYLH